MPSSKDKDPLFREMCQFMLLVTVTTTLIITVPAVIILLTVKFLFH